MVWPFSSGDSASSGDQTDPLKNLDPELRKFLEKESPLKYTPSAPPQSPIPPKAVQDSTATSAQETPSASDAPSTQPRPPSLFKDGRYDHLWKTYTPQADIEAANKSSDEKLGDMLAAYKDRKASIGAAALENCAVQQWEQNECYRSGSVTQRLGMCRAETKALERCYVMNARFLKALGYLSAYGRTEAQEEEIQMHADRLYRRMLEREAEEDKARAEGRPLPRFRPILEEGLGSRAAGAVDWEGVTEGAKAKFEERLRKLGPEERQIEEQAIIKEIEAGRDATDYIKGIRHEDNKAREARKVEGKSTVGDKIWNLIGRS